MNTPGTHSTLTRARLFALAKGLIGILVVLALLAFPFVNGNSFDVGRLQLSFVYVIAAVGLNVAYGLAGQFTLGHAFVMAVGAYTAGLLTAHAQWSIWMALVASVVVGVAASLLLAAPSIRVQGAYLGLLTLFAVLIIAPAVTIADEWTGGEFGLLGIPIVIFGDWDPATSTYILTLGVLVLSVLLSRNLVLSPWGSRLELLRDAPRAAESVGINIAPAKLLSYAIYGAIASLAGAMIAFNDAIVVPSTFSINLTLLILTGVVLGGKGTLWGPVIGTVPVILLSFYVGPFSPYNPIVFGLVLIVVVLTFPNGIVPAVKYGKLGRQRRAMLEARVSSSREDGQGSVAEDSDFPAYSEADGLAVEGPESSFGAPPTRGASERVQPVLQIADLNKSFGGVRAIQNFSLEVHPGQVVGLVGQNGCGKSTLLNMVNGYYKSDSGSIRIDGRDTTGWSPHRIARSGVGRTFQVPRLMEKASVVDNIAAGLIEQGRPRLLASLLGLPVVRREARLRRVRAKEMVGLLGLSDESASELADKLPLGLKRIVEVGRAAVGGPTLLLLDEPAAGLNDDERERLKSTILALAKTGVTPIVVEHNIEIVLSLCNIVILMESGAIVSIHDQDSAEPMPERMSQYLRYSEVE